LSACQGFRSPAELFQQCGNRDPVMRGHVAQDALQRADFDRAVIGDDFVMLAAERGRDAQV
jgi:hypothetical protein